MVDNLDRGTTNGYLYGIRHHKAERSGNVTDAGQTGQRTREDKATQLLDCWKAEFRNSASSQFLHQHHHWHSYQASWWWWWRWINWHILLPRSLSGKLEPHQQSGQPRGERHSPLQVSPLWAMLLCTALWCRWESDENFVLLMTTFMMMMIIAMVHSHT